MINSMVIAEYFLFLDRKKKYFNNSQKNTFNKEEISTPSVGNFRLNKLLFIANVLYIAKNNEKLFNNKICAFEYGPVIYNVLKNFRKLQENKIKKAKDFQLSDEIKIYIKKIYKNFSKYSDDELLNFVHEDPYWYFARKKWENDSDKLDHEVNSEIIFDRKAFKFYKDHLTIYINHFNL